MSDSKTDSSHDSGKTIAGWMIVLLWLLVLGGGTLLAQRMLDNRKLNNAPEWVSQHGGSPALLIKSDRYGQYQVEGRVNYQPVTFLIDSGATGISLSGVAAKRLNLERGRRFDVLTANGTAQVFSTQLDSLSIGPFTQRNVRAHINPAMKGITALLGMEFLRHYDLTQRRGELTISLP